MAQSPGLYGIVDHLIPRFKSPRHYLQLYGFLNHFEPLENEALNTSSWDYCGEKYVFKEHSAWYTVDSH